MLKNSPSNNIILKEHQKLPIKFMKDNFGLILYHSTGSGKTITALISMYQFNKDIVIIGPKSAKKAFTDEIEKLNYKKSMFTIYSYKKAKILMYEDYEIFKNKCVIIDEAHHLRSDTKDNIVFSGVLIYAFKVLLLTATPIVNHLSDISPLINIVKNKEVLPTNKELFNYFYENVTNNNNNNNNNNTKFEKDMLMDKIRNTISYYENINDEHFPKSQTYTRKVIMDGTQIKEYEQYVKRFIYDYQVPTNADILNIKFDLLKRNKLNSFLAATRQISNTVDGATDTAKLKLILKVLVREKYPAVIYSNYLKNGVYAMAKLLNKKNISFNMISGSTSPDKIDQIVNMYNNGEIKVLLLSTAGSESLDLKSTQQIHIMEPHWNDAKIQQIIGRAIRYKSHDSLEINKRFVKIFKWISVFPKKYHNLSADEYLLEISEKKTIAINNFKNILIEASIENNYKNILIENNLKRVNYKNKYLKYRHKYMEKKLR